MERKRKQRHVVREVNEDDVDDPASVSKPDEAMETEEIVIKTEPVEYVDSVFPCDVTIKDEPVDPFVGSEENDFTNVIKRKEVVFVAPPGHKDATVVDPAYESLDSTSYNVYVAKSSLLQVVDNVKLYIRKYFGRGHHLVHLDCPCCTQIKPHSLLGAHLQSAHGATHISCPGAKCPNGKEIPVMAFDIHLREYHMNVSCRYCHKKLLATELISHYVADHPIEGMKYYEPPPSDGPKLKGKPVSLQLRDGSNRRQLLGQVLERQHQQQQQQQQLKAASQENSAARPKKSAEQVIRITARLNQPGQRPVVVEPQASVVKGVQPPTRKRREVSYEVLLNGQIVKIDGITYYMDDDIAFVDCPLCPSRSVAVNLLGRHMFKHHNQEHVRCISKTPRCQETILHMDLEHHLLSEHAFFPCDTCSTILHIYDVADHADTCQFNSTSLLVVNEHLGRKFLSRRFEKSDLYRLPPRGNLMDHKLSKCHVCGKTFTNLNKHIRDVHMPKVECPVCGKVIGQSYLNEHVRIQHMGKIVPTRRCPLCNIECQKLRNHFRYQHKMAEPDVDKLYASTTTIYKRGGRGDFSQHTEMLPMITFNTDVVDKSESPVKTETPTDVNDAEK